MEPGLLKVLCCPDCKGDLVIKDEKMDGGEIFEGNLRCGKCDVDYPILDGIPNLLPRK